MLRFYRVQEEHGHFSNFASYPIFLDGRFWPTTEHYFQASKFEETAAREEICNVESPMKAASLGRKRKHKIRSDWNEIRDQVMRRAVEAKFRQHLDLTRALLETGDELIVEHTSNDAYWADGGDGTGQNKLGLVLMEVRDQLRALTRGYIFSLPPELAFPEVGEHDMFWRMGRGEDYVIRWNNYYMSLSSDEQEKYRETFPTIDWAGFS